MGTKLKLFYTAIMLFAVCIVLGGKIPSVGRHFIAKEPGYFVSDLYAMSELDRFKENISLVKRSETIAMEESEILTLGDSFFNSNLGSDQFASELANRGGYKVCNMQSSTFADPQGRPLEYLKSIGYKAGKKRILILETVERAAISRSNTYNAAYLPSVNPLVAKSQSLFRNEDVEYFFKKNFIVRPLIGCLKGIRFRFFGIVDKSIGAYSENPDMLFFKDEVQFDRYPKSAATIDSVAESISLLSEKLKKLYDIDLVYVVIPNKYSIYGDFSDKGYRYDGFIPLLTEKLTARGVRNVDLYSVYLNGRKSGKPLLYYSSDTHYTALGKSLLVDACIKVIND